jgi:hypothetical protein
MRLSLKKTAWLVGSELKIWDGFTFALENEGGWITFGKLFRC